MRARRASRLDPRIDAAVRELQTLISARYPSATFQLSPDTDEPPMVLLTATVDVDDPDEVLDLVLDRMLELQIEERVPVQVVPVRTSERIAADDTIRSARGGQATAHVLSQHGGSAGASSNLRVTVFERRLA